MSRQFTPGDPIDRESRSARYYRNAVERHWDPGEIDLERDRERFTSFVDAADRFERADLDAMVAGIAKFGAGEDAVTADLAPLAVVLEGVEDQLFLATQLYEEAKHADFFDRYWREVVWAVEDHLGWERSNPRDGKWFTDAYVELFDRNRRALHRLLADDTPERRAIAYSHYHLTVEGILAQTGYFGIQRSFGGEYDELPHLPGLVEGFVRIRSDEGRHVGFGMSQLNTLVGDGAVDPSLIEDTVVELLPLVRAIAEDDRFQPADRDGPVGVPAGELAGYAMEKHAQRLEQIADAAELPDVDELVSLERGD